MKICPGGILFVLLLSVAQSKGEKSQDRQFVTPNETIPLLRYNLNVINDTISDSNQDEIHRSGSENGFILKHLLKAAPPFIITAGNENCKKDSQKFFEHLLKMDLWALKMYDSTGKLPSGLLNGNINQFGDFDECLSVKEPISDIRGKYCLAYLQIRSLSNNYEEGIYEAFKLMHSHFLFKSKLSDPGHRVPRFSTMNWGLCIPSSCTSQDAESQLRRMIQRNFNQSGFSIEVKIDAEMCQQKEPFEMSASFVLVSCLFLIVITISFVSTLRDVFLPEESSDRFSIWSILNCFSLVRNGKILTSLTRSSDDIHSVHGIRMINALMLVLSHKSMALFFMPYSNRTSMVEKLSQPWTLIARTASLYTDSFIMISGLLTSYSFLRVLQKDGKLNFKYEYINRLIRKKRYPSLQTFTINPLLSATFSAERDARLDRFYEAIRMYIKKTTWSTRSTRRIVPSLAAIVLLCTFILPKMGSGPQWNLTVSHHANQCRETWWKNFLFIHNYLGFENMCLTHTHHLGIDTQLFFISPFLVLLLHKFSIFGISALIGLAAVTTMARFQATAEKNLSYFIYPGISVGQMFDTANHSYIIPFHRLTSYIIGILLGYTLRRCGKDIKIKTNFLRLGWTVTFSFLSYILTKANDMNHIDYVYDNNEAAIYAALAPIAWCLFLGWLIFLSHMGYGGTIDKVICSKYSLIWTRLSYAVYLTQFPVFFFNVGLQKYPQQYSLFLLINVLEYGCVLLASVALTLFFDIPFVNLKKLFIQR